MDNVTHFAALRAAARVAFGIAVLGGCTAAATEEDTVANESKISKAPCPSKADAGAKLSCDDLIAASFPGVDPDAYIWEPKAGASAELEACCKDKLVATSGAMPYRFYCCTVVDRDAEDPDWKLGAACTPWGPPVPPSMKRRRTALPMIQGVA